MRKKILLFIPLILFVNIISCQAQMPDPKVKASLPQHCLDSLFFNSLVNKQIVMLGDGCHGHGYYKKMLTGLLSTWLDKLEREPGNKTIPRKLVLFLENDSLSQKFCYQVMNEGNLDNYLTNLINGMSIYGGHEKYSVDDIEYLYDLGCILKRVNELNNNHSFKDVNLVVQGVEAKAPFDYQTAFRMGKDYFKQMMVWQAKEREKIICNNIARFMTDNRDYKGIVFYGNAHLMRRYVDMSFLNKAKDKESIWGYFLAHYLDEQFGKNNVAIYYTGQIHGVYDKIIKELEPSMDNEDYHLLWNAVPEFPFPIYLITNKSYLKSLISQTDTYIDGNDREDKLLFIKNYRDFFNRIYRSYLHFDKRYESIIDSLGTYPMKSGSKDLKFINKTTRKLGMQLLNEFDLVKNIEHMEKWILMDASLDDEQIYCKLLQSLVYNLPRDTTPDVFYKSLNSSINVYTLNQFEKDQIKKRISELKIYYAISSLWVNSNEENERVFSFLRMQTGVNYRTPKEWSEWWRKKYKY